MKTAVIYSGQARTFGQLFENHWWHVLRKLEDPEFFVSVQDDAQAADMTRLWEKFPPDRVHIEYVEQPTLPDPAPESKWLNLYPRSSPAQSVLRQLWALNRARLFSVHADLVIRLRPDLAFARFEMPRHRDISHLSCHTPWWSRWGGVNDRVAVMGCDAAFHYFTTFTKIDRLRALGCPFHPEQLIAASLEDGRIEPSHTLAAEFITVRLDGSHVPMDATQIELADYVRSQ